MQMRDHVVLMAQYNQWMNQRVYDAAARLDPAELVRDRGAFFGSILATLNHLVVADLLWLRRFRAGSEQPALLAALDEWPVPSRLDERLFPEIGPLRALREALDRLIRDWANALREQDMDRVVGYRNMRGENQRKALFSVAMHLFNHQTHHRGQLATLLTQAGQDVGVTDLVALIPNQAEV